MLLADLLHDEDCRLELLDGERDVLAHLSPELRIHRERRAGAPPPEARHLGVLDDAHKRGARAKHVAELIAEIARLKCRPVSLHHQHEARVAWDAPWEAPTSRAQRIAVKELDGCWAEPRRIDVSNCAYASAHIFVPGDDRNGQLRRGREPEPGAGDDAERALGPDQQGTEVVPRNVLAQGPAKLRHRPRREHRFDSGHPVTCDAIFEGMRSTGIARDIPADLRLLAGPRIGWEEEPVLPGEAMDSGCHDPGIHLHAP